MSEPARVAVLSAGLSDSGGDRVLSQVTEALLAGGASVRWLVPAGRDRARAVISDAVVVEPIALRSRGLAPFELAWRSRDYDVVIAASPDLALGAWLMLRGRRRVVWFLQGWATPSGRSRAALSIMRTAERILRHSRMRTAVVSEPLQRELPRATLLRNGVDLRRFTPRAPGSEVRVVGSILSGGKLHYLQELAALRGELAKRQPGLEVRVLTPEPIDFDGMATVDGRSVAPWSFLQDCDVFVSASRMDGFALPPLEAMACGVPVVAVPTMGLLAYASDGENALFAPGGTTEQIAELVGRLASSADLRLKLRENGLATAAEYSLEASEMAYRAYFLGGGERPARPSPTTIIQRKSNRGSNQ